MEPSPEARSVGALIVGVIGMVLYVVIGWLYLASGLLVPFPWYIVLWVIWAGGLFVLGRVFRRRPLWTPVVPVAALAVWVTYIQVGSRLFGWTA
ncbi:MAG: hypothetical protein U9N56_08730 [Actinomycetota bacterium]|nr:hypothetical protein [Actinomycetota bacterium]